MRHKINKETYGNKASAGKVTRKTQKGVSDSNVNDQEKDRPGLTPETAARTAEVDSLALKGKKKLEFGDVKCVFIICILIDLGRDCFRLHRWIRARVCHVIGVQSRGGPITGIQLQLFVIGYLKLDTFVHSHVSYPLSHVPYSF